MILTKVDLYTMKYILYIVLFIGILVIPNFIFGQTDKGTSKAHYRDLKAQGYASDIEMIDTALISVNDSVVKTLLLLDREKTKYKSIEEAAMDVNRLLNTISSERVSAQKVNGGLAFKIAQRQVINKRKDKIAQDAWEEMISKETTTVDDLIQLKEKFNNRPTYYVNGYQVGQDVLNKIRESEVLTREYRVLNTASGNPNGEIWYEITPKAAARIKLEEFVNHESTIIFSKKSLSPNSIDNNIEAKEQEKDELIIIQNSEKEINLDKKKKKNTISSLKKQESQKSVRKVKENIQK